MSGFSILLVFFSSISSINCAVKMWNPIESDYWKYIGNEKCSLKKMVLSKHLDGVFYMDMGLPNAKPFGELVLPSDGVIIMPKALQVSLINTDECATGSLNGYLTLQQTKSKSWFDTSNWNNQNIATPHVERIPCECDRITIPPVSATSIDLEMVEVIVADKIQINERQSDFTKFLETRVGQRMFTNSDAVRFEQGVCKPPKHLSCHSVKHYHDYYGLVCERERPKCELPRCLNPILPRGHCCDMCGAIIEFRIRDDPKEFKWEEMNRIIQSKLKRFRSGKYANSLVYHIGFVGDKTEDQFVQLVITELNEYDGSSVEFVNYIKKDPHFQGNRCLFNAKHIVGI